MCSSKCYIGEYDALKADLSHFSNSEHPQRTAVKDNFSVSNHPFIAAAGNKKNSSRFITVLSADLLWMSTSVGIFSVAFNFCPQSALPVFGVLK